MPLHEYAVEPEDQAELLAWLGGPRPAAATPRGSSTVLLLRPGSSRPGSRGADDGAGGVEVFLLRRRASMAFAPRMHAFPGGGVDPRDSDADVPWAGPSPEDWAARLHCPTPLASALVCAAVRETFEECGVLLAGTGAEASGAEASGAEASGDVVADVSGDDWERDRLALLDRSLAMSELLVRRGLRLRSDLLRPWAHWTTPEHESRRYDTWFFLAALPAGQHARDIGGESDRAHWMGLDEVLTGYARGRLPMFPPTAATISEVVAAVRDRRPGQSGIEGALAASREVRRVMPWLGRTPEGAAVMRVDLDGRGGGSAGPADQCSVAGLP